MKFANPIIPGFYPDPSLCRVDDDFYLATSTFEYFPGVPIFHSRDLVHWRQIGHCLTRPSQLPLAASGCSQGIYAPTLRHHAGRFYMVTTNVTTGRKFYVWADDPAGGWSEPIFVESAGGDPSLFFDDGTCYYTDCGVLGAWQFPIDIATGKPLAKPRHIWTGTGGRWPEAPHLYKIGGKYFLMLSEGGTEFAHAVTVGRANSPWGPFQSCPYNPILTHVDRPHTIQATGHADLVQVQDGSWWAVFLAIRAPHGLFHHLGRETFLAPVHWTSDGWPIIGGRADRLDEFCRARLAREAMPIRDAAQYEIGCLVPPDAPASVDLTMDAPALPASPWPMEPIRDDFDAPDLGLCWNFLRNPYAADWSLSARSGFLRLSGSGVTLDDTDSPAFVGRRQQHLSCRAAACVEFQPVQVGDEAGLTVLLDNKHHYEIAVTRLAAQDQPVIIVRRRIGDLQAVVAQAVAPRCPIILHIQAQPTEYSLGFAPADTPDNATLLATAATRYLSSEVAGGFTGVYIGMYATGNGRRCGSPADFDWFEYHCQD